MTSSAHFADLKGEIVRRTICPSSFTVITLIFSQLRELVGGGGGGAKKPSLNMVKVQWLEAGMAVSLFVYIRQQLFCSQHPILEE